MLKKAIYTFCFLSIIAQSAKCQLMPEMVLKPSKDEQNKEYAVGKVAITTPLSKSLNDYFQIVDTIDLIHNEQYLVKVEGLNFQFNLRIHRDSNVFNHERKKILQIESRISPYQSWNYDITNLNIIELASVSQELREKSYDKPVLSTAFQSCISYALEGIFRSNGINPESFFFRRSGIAKYNDTEAILKHLFIKVETLDNVKNKTIRKSKKLYEEQVLILFRNNSGNPIHACFNLNGRTWTKNGMMPYSSIPSPRHVIDSYNWKKKIKSNYSQTRKDNFRLRSVSSIEIYRLNYEMFE